MGIKAEETEMELQDFFPGFAPRFLLSFCPSADVAGVWINSHTCGMECIGNKLIANWQ